MFLSDISMKLGFNWKKVGKDKFLSVEESKLIAIHACILSSRKDLK